MAQIEGQSNQIYEDQLHLLQYLQSIDHPEYKGDILIIGYFQIDELRQDESEKVSFISDAGFDTNPPGTEPEDMHYTHVHNGLVHTVMSSDGHIVDGMKVSGVEQVLRVGKPIVRRS